MSKTEEQLAQEAKARFEAQTFDELHAQQIRFLNNAIKNGAAMPDIILMIMHNTLDWKRAQKLTMVDKIAQLVQAKRKENAAN